ncbi:MAG: c-type cytochrome [Bacteroidetes bacterium]|nr:c-type cytochrome [Bacteroidota bacterium]
MKPSKIILPIFLLLPLSVFAASGATDTHFNATFFAMVSMIVVLIAANGLLANVLLQLAFALREKKMKNPAKQNESNTAIKSILLFLIFLLPALNSFAQEAAADSTAAAPVSQMIGGIAKSDFYLLTGIAGFLFLVMLVLILLIRMMTRELRGVPFSTSLFPGLFKKNLIDSLNNSVSLEKEDTIVLDHDYDGIRELDNDLPPWWKWGFIFTIIVSVLYMGYYQFGGGPNQVDEYNASVAKAEAEQAKLLSKSGAKIDENNVQLITDPTELANAKALFANTCAACHGADGGGTVGPNLTDAYWLHGGSVKDVFKSIKYGWKDKGMPSWDKNLSAKQIQDLTGFIESLKGSKPASPKAPQGDLYKAEAAPAADSTAKS